MAGGHIRSSRRLHRYSYTVVEIVLGLTSGGRLSSDDGTLRFVGDSGGISEVTIVPGFMIGAF